MDRELKKIFSCYNRKNNGDFKSELTRICEVSRAKMDTFVIDLNGWGEIVIHLYSEEKRPRED